MDHNDSEQKILEAEQSAEEDRLWVEKLQKGNTRAFDFLLRKYQRRLYAIVYNLTSNKEDAADITQDVFIKAYKSINSFQGNSSFYTWLYRIAMNTTISFIRKNRKKSIVSLENWEDSNAQDVILSHVKTKDVGDKATLLKELQEKLNESLQKLSVIHRTVIVLFEIDGLSHGEIAKILHCSEGTVRSRLHYAKEQLKLSLKHYLKDEEKR